MAERKIHIYKVWRSEFSGLVIFCALLAAAVILSRQFPGSVIKGDLFTIGSRRILLSLPLIWLIPATWLGMLIVRIYNVLYLCDSRGLEGYRGILSFSRTITRIRYEDVRSIETDQTLMERILDVGNVEIGTAASADVDLILVGVANPKAIQDFVQNERDRRQHLSLNEQQQVATGRAPSREAQV